MVAEQNDPRVSAPARCSTGGFANLGSEAIACTNATLTWEVLTSSPNPASQTYHSHARGCRCVQIIKFGHCVVFQDDARSHFGWRFHFSLPIRNQEILASLVSIAFSHPLQNIHRRGFHLLRLAFLDEICAQSSWSQARTFPRSHRRVKSHMIQH